MRLTISEPAQLADLRGHLDRHGFRCHPADSDTLKVVLPGERGAEFERQELSVLLDLWMAMHPGVAVRVAD